MQETRKRKSKEPKKEVKFLLKKIKKVSVCCLFWLFRYRDIKVSALDLIEFFLLVSQEKNGNSPISPLKSPSKIPSYQPRPASITPKTRSRSTSKQRLSLKASPDTDHPEPLIKSKRAND